MSAAHEARRRPDAAGGIAMPLGPSRHIFLAPAPFPCILMRAVVHPADVADWPGRRPYGHVLSTGQVSLPMKPHPFLVLLAVALVPACNQGPNSPQQSAGADAGKYGKYTLHGTKYDNVDQNKAKDNAADVLTQLQDEPNVCMVGLWAYNPPAIL